MTRGRGVPPPVMVDDTGSDRPEAPRLRPPASKADRTRDALALTVALGREALALRLAWTRATQQPAGRRGTMIARLKDRAMRLFWIYIENDRTPDPHLWLTIRDMLDVKPGRPGSLVRRLASDSRTRSAFNRLVVEDEASGGRLTDYKLHEITGVGEAVIKALRADPDYPVKRQNAKK